jgi:hypothetical protein
MKKDTVIHVYCSDWEGIYLNDSLLFEGHSLRAYDWFKLGKTTNVQFNEIKLIEIKDSVLYHSGSLPETFSELKKMMTNDK